MKTRQLILLATILLYAPTAPADEGMWLFNQPPRQLLKDRYQFELTDAWLERAQQASIRFNNGGSGSFVSPDGLVVTNHHIGADLLQKLSTKDKNLHKDGFHARTRDQELKCPDLELNVLDSIEDVTAAVQQAVQAGPIEKAAELRRARLAEIEKASKDKTGLRSDVVTLYHGGLYHLYRYKKYTDVRLVFAPEHDIAAFGGDVDNFEYPRWNLDICFFRVYENGAPLKTPHYFRWSAVGPVENDVVFVSGHPGTTNRLETYAKLVHRRDVTLPYYLAKLRHQEAMLLQYSARGPEQARVAGKDLYSIANARKALTGQLHGLLTPVIMQMKEKGEQALLAPGQLPDKLGKEKQAAAAELGRIAQGLRDFRAEEKEYFLLEMGDACWSQQFRIARHIVRLLQEKAKPNGKRLREYRDTAQESLLLQLLSPAPISTELEQIKLIVSLAFLAEQLGGDHKLVRQVLGNESPAELGTRLARGTRLGAVAYRKQLLADGLDKLKECADPMIQFALHVDNMARLLRERYENLIVEPEQQSYAKLAALRFQLYGTSQPPDATFTLRLAFGVVKGYEVEGQTLPYTTRFGGVFERAAALKYREPFALPESWLKKQDKLDLQTPFNFVSTADTIGGNSGSPVLNRAGELVGINFDRNRHGLVRNFVYTEVGARHISVHSRAVLEALRQVYDANELLAELLPKQ